MADEKLSWALQFDLTGQGLQEARAEMDKLQASLKRGQKAMFDFEVAGKRVSVELTGLGQKTDTFSDKLKKATFSVDSFVGGLLKLGAAGAAAITGTFYALDKLGDKALKAFGEKQGTLRAYTTLLGDAAQAEKEYGKAQALALKTDLTAEDTIKSQKKLMVAGFRGDDLDRALLGVADVAAMASPEERQLTMERLGKAFADVRSKGKLQGEELKQLTEAGLGRGLIVDEVRKSLGLKDNAATEKAISKGDASAEIGIAAIERAILRQFNTQRLGQYATGSAGTLSGLLSNKDEVLDNLFRSFDSEKLPAVQMYKKSLADFTEALSKDTESGRNLAVVLQDLSNTSIGLKSAWTEFSTGFLEAFGGSYVGAMEDTTQSLKDTGAALRKLGADLGEELGPKIATLNQGLAKTGEVLKLLWEGMGEFTHWLFNPGKYIAGSFTDVQKGETWRQILGLGAKKRNAFDAPEEETPEAKRAREGKERGRETDEQYKARIAAEDGPQPFGPPAPPAEDAKKKAAAASAKAASGSKGGGGGLGSLGGTFVPDYSDLKGGMSLPGVTIPGLAGGGMSFATVPYAAEQQRALSAGIAERQRLELEWSGDMIIDGAQEPGAVADEVEARLLRKFGRYTRTPRQAVT